MRCGVRLAELTVARIPDFVAPQLCRMVDRPPTEPGWGHEVKFDGYRLQLRVVDGTATLKTRNALDWTPRFAAIAADARQLPDCLIDGEVVALDHRRVPNFALCKRHWRTTSRSISSSLRLISCLRGTPTCADCLSSSARHDSHDCSIARPGNTYGTCSIWNLARIAYCFRLAKWDSKGSCRSVWTHRTARDARIAGGSRNAAPVMRSFSADGPANRAPAIAACGSLSQRPSGVRGPHRHRIRTRSR